MTYSFQILRALHDGFPLPTDEVSLDTPGASVLHGKRPTRDGWRPLPETPVGRRPACQNQEVELSGGLLK